MAAGEGSYNPTGYQRRLRLAAREFVYRLGPAPMATTPAARTPRRTEAAELFHGRLPEAVACARTRQVPVEYPTACSPAGLAAGAPTVALPHPARWPGGRAAATWIVDPGRRRETIDSLSCLDIPGGLGIGKDGLAGRAPVRWDHRRPSLRRTRDGESPNTPAWSLSSLRLLDVAAELAAHGREQLVGEVGLAARRESPVEGGREHRGRHALVDGRLDRPAASPCPTRPRAGQRRVLQGAIAEMAEQPGGDDAAASATPR